MNPQPCDLCGQTEFAPVWNRGHPGVTLSTVVCKSCGLVQTNPRPSQEELNRFYAEEYRIIHTGKRVPDQWARKAMIREAEDRFADFLEHLNKPAKVLEIGCGVGEFLRVLRDHAHIAEGVELDPELAAIAKQHCELSQPPSSAMNPGVASAATPGKGKRHGED